MEDSLSGSFFIILVIVRLVFESFIADVVILRRKKRSSPNCSVE